MSKSEKLSFSLSSAKPKPQSSSSTRPNPKFHEEIQPNEREPRAQYVTEFDASKTLAPSPQIGLPPKENTFNFRTKKMKNLRSGDEAALRFELENPSSAHDPTSDMSFGLNLRNKQNGNPKPSDPGRPPSYEEESVQKLREDLKNLSDDRGFDEFKDVPVESFGTAYLAAYGWSEGQGIGRNPKEDVQVRQYLRHAGNGGLGFVSDLPNVNRKQKLGGGGRTEEPPLVAPVGPDGRTRHIVGIDEKLVPREVRGVVVGKVVRIIDGRHVGLKGKVVEKLGSDFESQSVILKLLKSEEEVRVAFNQVAEVGSVEEEKFLKKLQESKSRGKDERRVSSSRDHREKRDDREENGSKNRKRKTEGGERDRRESQVSSRDGSSRGADVRSPFSWLTSHIKVRIISKDFRGGRLYLKKGAVLDVVGPTKCDISMDGNKELIQGVDQEILETAIPKSGGPVLVLFGKHKGVFGSLVESDKERETGVVRDADTHALLNVRLEQIAEYVGDPSYLGY